MSQAAPADDAAPAVELQPRGQSIEHEPNAEPNQDHPQQPLWMNESEQPVDESGPPVQKMDVNEKADWAVYACCPNSCADLCCCCGSCCCPCCAAGVTNSRRAGVLKSHCLSHTCVYILSTICCYWPCFCYKYRRHYKEDMGIQDGRCGRCGDCLFSTLCPFLNIAQISRDFAARERKRLADSSSAAVKKEPEAGDVEMANLNEEDAHEKPPVDDAVKAAPIENNKEHLSSDVASQDTILHVNDQPQEVAVEKPASIEKPVEQPVKNDVPAVVKPAAAPSTSKAEASQADNTKNNSAASSSAPSNTNTAASQDNTASNNSNQRVAHRRLSGNRPDATNAANATEAGSATATATAPAETTPASSSWRDPCMRLCSPYTALRSATNTNAPVPAPDAAASSAPAPSTAAPATAAASTASTAPAAATGDAAAAAAPPAAEGNVAQSNSCSIM